MANILSVAVELEVEYHVNAATNELDLLHVYLGNMVADAHDLLPCLSDIDRVYLQEELIQELQRQVD